MSNPVFVVANRAKDIDQQWPSGDPITDKNGNPQWKMRVNLQGQDPKVWHSIFGPANDPLFSQIQKGTRLQGKISNNGKNFFVDAILPTDVPAASPIPPQGANGSAGGGGGTIHTPAAAADDRQRSIIRQHSQGVGGAVEALKAEIALGLVPVASSDDFYALLKQRIDWFAEDATP